MDIIICIVSREYTKSKKVSAVRSRGTILFKLIKKCAQSLNFVMKFKKIVYSVVVSKA